MNEATLLDVSLPPVTDATSEGPSASASPRSTVLPRITLSREGARLVRDDRERFESARELGRGGVGEVILARDNDIDRPVAIKRLLPGADDADGVARFIEEIRTLGCLDHPNIVPVHDVGLGPDGRYYYVMKYVEGETLEHVIEKLAAGDAEYHRRYTFARRVEVFCQILRGVQYAHARGIIHRDLKPANVMVGRFGEVMVMDWGIARRIRTASDVSFPVHETAATLSQAPAKVPAQFRTLSGSLLGTPAYMSPEQARGDIDALDERSDVYALCVIFHELLTLKHYLAGRRTIADCIAGVLRDGVPFAHFVSNPHQPAPPPDLSHFIRHGVEKDPAKRYRSVDEMLAGLERIEDGRCLVECPSTFSKRAVNELSRAVDHHPLWVMGGGIAALATLAAAAATVVARV